MQVNFSTARVRTSSSVSLCQVSQTACTHMRSGADCKPTHGSLHFCTTRIAASLQKSLLHASSSNVQAASVQWQSVVQKKGLRVYIGMFLYRWEVTLRGKTLSLLHYIYTGREELCANHLQVREASQINRHVYLVVYLRDWKKNVSLMKRFWKKNKGVEHNGFSRNNNILCTSIVTVLDGEQCNFGPSRRDKWKRKKKRYRISFRNLNPSRVEIGKLRFWCQKSIVKEF